MGIDSGLENMSEWTAIVRVALDVGLGNLDDVWWRCLDPTPPAILSFVVYGFP